MGSASSKSTINKAINSVIKLHVGSNSGCYSSLENITNVTITNTGSGTINIGDIDLSQYVSASSSCIQSTSVNASVTDAITTLIKNTADTINQNLTAAGPTKAETVTNLVTNLLTQVSIEITQTCAANVLNSNSLTITNTSSGVTTVGVVKASQFIESVSKCVQSSQAVAGIKQQLMDQITSEASATVQFLGNAAFYIAIIIAVYFIAVSQGVSKLLDPKTMSSIAFLVCLYVVVASSWKGKPYGLTKTTLTCVTPGCTTGPYAPEDPAEVASNKSIVRKNHLILLMATAGAVVSGAIAVKLNSANRKGVTLTPSTKPTK